MKHKDHIDDSGRAVYTPAESIVFVGILGLICLWLWLVMSFWIE